MKLIDAWRYWCRPLETPGKSAQAELPLDQPRTLFGLPQAPLKLPKTKPAAVELFRSGRWHLRDGNKFGKPPYYGQSDAQTGHLRLTDKR